MARPTMRLPSDAPGPFDVDGSCVAGGPPRQWVPQHIGPRGAHTPGHIQPIGEWRRQLDQPLATWQAQGQP